jgi:hypothetical protein
VGSGVLDFIDWDVGRTGFPLGVLGGGATTTLEGNDTSVHSVWRR